MLISRTKLKDTAYGRVIGLGKPRASLEMWYLEARSKKKQQWHGSVPADSPDHWHVDVLSLTFNSCRDVPDWTLPLRNWSLLLVIWLRQNGDDHWRLARSTCVQSSHAALTSWIGYLPIQSGNHVFNTIAVIFYRTWWMVRWRCCRYQIMSIECLQHLTFPSVRVHLGIQKRMQPDLIYSQTAVALFG